MNLKINPPKNAALAVKMLLNSGFEAGFVGGCIRDALMNKTPNDWDICTSATPYEIQEVFKDFKKLTIGLKHGTIVVIIDKEQIEITTYRIDGTYSDGRHPDKVCFTRNLLEDLKRRDYTQNAIFFNEFQGIIDPFNGISDIKNKTIRAVGEPNKRLQEDALRILRGVRFSSTLGFNIEKYTKKAMFKNKELLKNISQERITVEFIKLIQGKNIVNVLKEFKDIIAYIIPEMQDLIDFSKTYDLWIPTIISVNDSKDLILKLTMLFRNIGKPYCYSKDKKGNIIFHDSESRSCHIASIIFKRMKITNAEELNKNDVKDIIELIKYQNILIEPNKNSIKKILYELRGNKLQFRRLLEIKRISILSENHSNSKDLLKKYDNIEKIFCELLRENPCVCLKDLDINGKDLISLGISPGIRIGKILNELLKDVINEVLPNNKSALINAAKKYLS
ncbi:CCA tRNA nucleotidyltransferase [Clostridium niameyense]|uniref:CCA tRNA nucleotidyltransferase n=1 Tax=Clostridium niameyense TaxID=1622073 RepID=A0A6M0R7T8_9CLOT|nr:CCA tRNA nucleotidyltransferase [Clostridium niameyense]NEZ46275.1 CCA tRNA nucleotidyltransferase [Clostridium niameyense]